MTAPAVHRIVHRTWRDLAMRPTLDALAATPVEVLTADLAEAKLALAAAGAFPVAAGDLEVYIDALRCELHRRLG